MRLRHSWTVMASASLIFAGAAFADVTVSQSNEPAASIGGQMASLLGAEKTALGQVAPARMARLAEGAQPPSDTKKSSLTTPSLPKLIRYDKAFLDALPVAKGDENWQCLATAIYHEARGESIRGQFAVAEVVLNRKESAGFPQTVCGVVNQKGGGSCQFSFTCDGRPDTASEKAAWVDAGKIARVMLDGAPRALTLGATYFHTVGVRPSWSRRFDRTAAIGAHMFYRQ